MASRDNCHLRELCNNHKDVTISLVIKDSRNKIGKLTENVDDQLFELLPDFLTDEQLNAAIL